METACTMASGGQGRQGIECTKGLPYSPFRPFVAARGSGMIPGAFCCAGLRQPFVDGRGRGVQPGGGKRAWRGRGVVVRRSSSDARRRASRAWRAPTSVDLSGKGRPGEKAVGWVSHFHISYRPPTPLAVSPSRRRSTTAAKRGTAFCCRHRVSGIQM
jgi:hypothetical protein